MSEAIRLVVVNAGMSDASSTRLLADRLSEAFTDAVGASTVEVVVHDLRDLAVDIATSLTSGFGVGAVKQVLDDVYSADALIAATPVFNASYNGLFKSFVDLVDVEAMGGKPVLIAATGGSPRHAMVLDHAMRPLFSYLRAVVAPTGVYAAAEDWAGTSGDTATLNDRIRRAARELARLVGVGAGGPVVAGPERAGGRVAVAEAAGIDNFAKLLG